jgi:hypothetical protein
MITDNFGKINDKIIKSGYSLLSLEGIVPFTPPQKVHAPG